MSAPWIVSIALLSPSSAVVLLIIYKEIKTAVRRRVMEKQFQKNVVDFSTMEIDYSIFRTVEEVMNDATELDQENRSSPR
jgi:uncharacterized protein YktA (UPF0223 family)